MATRSSGSSNRSKKSSAPPLPPVINLPDESHTESTDSESRAASESQGEVQITKSKLEQREIPSFSESREARIAERAYWRAERRGFEPGHELEDWLHAEKDVDGDGSST
jgi:hypothetical protein